MQSAFKTDKILQRNIKFRFSLKSPLKLKRTLINFLLVWLKSATKISKGLQVSDEAPSVWINSMYNSNRTREVAPAEDINCQNRRCTYTSKTHLFNRCSQRKPLQAARMSFEPAKVIYVRFQPLFYLFYSKYSRRNTLCQSRQHQAIQLWLHLQQITHYSFGGTAHWFNRHRDRSKSFKIYQ